MEFTDDQIRSLSLIASSKKLSLYSEDGKLQVSGHPIDLKRMFRTDRQFFERLAHYQEHGKIETEY